MAVGNFLQLSCNSICWDQRRIQWWPAVQMKTMGWNSFIGILEWSKGVCIYVNRMYIIYVYMCMYDRPLGLIWTPPLTFILYHPFCRTLIFSFSFQAPRSRTLRNFLNFKNFLNLEHLQNLQNFWAQKLSKFCKFSKFRKFIKFRKFRKFKKFLGGGSFQIRQIQDPQKLSKFNKFSKFYKFSKFRKFTKFTKFLGPKTF